MDIGQDLVFKGYWWLPKSSSAKKVPGELRCFRDGHVQLTLFGSLYGPMTLGLQREVSIPVILGVSEDGKSLTLFENLLTHWTLRLPGIPEEQYVTRFLLIGAHFQDLSALRFTAATLRTLGIDEWVGITGLSVEADIQAKRCSIVFQQPERREFSIDGERRLAVTFSETMPSSGTRLKRASIEQRTHLQIAYSQGQPLEQVLADMKKIGDFLTLGIGKPAALTAVSLSTATDKGAEEEEARGRQRVVRLYYQSLPGPQDGFDANPGSMTFNWEEIESECGSILANWFALYDAIAPALNWFFAIQYREGLYLESQFLVMVQSLEAFHRRLLSNEVEPADQHRERVERILRLVGEADRSWLKQRLQYSNEPSLRQRLEQLIEPSQALFSNRREKRRFIDSVVTTRNYLTHYDQKLCKRSLEGSALYDAVKKLRLVFTIQVLRRIGFEDQQVLAMVTRNPRLKEQLGS